MQQFAVTGDLGQRVANANLIAPQLADTPRSDAPDLQTPLVSLAQQDSVTADAPPTAIQATLVQAAALRLNELAEAAKPDPAKLITRLSAEAELLRAAKAAGLADTPPA
jgi:hypothetical protein